MLRFGSETNQNWEDIFQSVYRIDITTLLQKISCSESRNDPIHLTPKMRKLCFSYFQRDSASVQRHSYLTLIYEKIENGYFNVDRPLKVDKQKGEQNTCGRQYKSPCLISKICVREGVKEKLIIKVEFSTEASPPLPSVEND